MGVDDPGIAVDDPAMGSLCRESCCSVAYSHDRAVQMQNFSVQIASIACSNRLCHRKGCSSIAHLDNAGTENDPTSAQSQIELSCWPHLRNSGSSLVLENIAQFAVVHRKCQVADVYLDLQSATPTS